MLRRLGSVVLMLLATTVGGALTGCGSPADDEAGADGTQAASSSTAAARAREIANAYADAKVGDLVPADISDAPAAARALVDDKVEDFHDVVSACATLRVPSLGTYFVTDLEYPSNPADPVKSYPIHELHFFDASGKLHGFGTTYDGRIAFYRPVLNAKGRIDHVEMLDKSPMASSLTAVFAKIVADAYVAAGDAAKRVYFDGLPASVQKFAGTEMAQYQRQFEIGSKLSATPFSAVYVVGLSWSQPYASGPRTAHGRYLFDERGVLRGYGEDYGDGMVFYAPLFHADGAWVGGEPL